MSHYNIGVKIRINRILEQGKAVIVAADHRTTIGQQQGLDFDLISQIAVKSKLNGIIIRPSMATHLCDMSLAGVPLLMYLTGKLDRGVDHVPFNTVEYALSCGADAVCTEFKFGSEGDLKNAWECSRIAEEAHKLGLPNLVTTYVLPVQQERMGNAAYAHACVIAEELGADIIKIGLPDDENIMLECVKSVRTPILLAGGANESAESLAYKVDLFMRKGGAGIVAGRNMWGSTDMQKMATLLRKIVFSN